jgi:predicted nucleic acid-binding Zn ribbon protein
MRVKAAPKLCPICGNPTPSPYFTYCSDKCRYEQKLKSDTAWRNRAKNNPVEYSNTDKKCPVCGNNVGAKKYTYCSDKCKYQQKLVHDHAYRERNKAKHGLVPCGCGTCGLTFKRRHSRQLYSTACPNREKMIEATKRENQKGRRKVGRKFDPANNTPGGGRDKKVKFIDRERAWIDHNVIQIYAKALRTGNQMDLQSIRAINKPLKKELDRCVKIFIQTRMMAMMKREPSRVHLWPLKKEMGV